MGKIDKWQREVDRLDERISEMEDLQMSDDGGDITDDHIDKLRASRDKYQEMIDSYEGDNV